ncbi:MAG: ATP-binding protein [Pseudomonadota bacterium]
MPTRIESLISDLRPLSPSQSIGEVFDWFLIHSDKQAMPVVFERTVVGLVSRAGLLEHVSRLSDPSMSTQPVMACLDTAPVTAKLGQPLGEVAMTIAQNGGKGFQTGVIVTQGGAYYGYVSALSLAMALSAENTQRAHKMRLAARKLKYLNAQMANLRRESGQALARFGHEVRTPLTAMLGHTERLLRQDTAPEARESLDVLARASESLADLVTRTVEAGRIGAQDVPVVGTAFSPVELAGELGALWQPKADEKQLTLEISVARGLPARIEGDAVRIRQILGNLISNAIKYTPAGRVDVVFDGKAREEGQIAFTVDIRDTGPGVPEADVDKLFKPFQRLTQEAGAPEQGVGLGLNISRGLAEAMGGDIKFGPREEGGSVFNLSLPLRRAGPRLASEGTVQKARKPRSAFQLGDILLIEDHAASQALIESTLQSAGWQVDTVATLSQARRRVDHKPYQAILCDYFLRDGQGDVLIKMLRGHEGPNRDTLCLAVTADSSEARRKHCLAAGFAGVIVKPIRGPDLITTLADFITDAEAPLPETDALRA